MSAARVAGAPISWGVCEVPGWGYQLGAKRVLAEMAAIGLQATEVGPEGFLSPEPAGLRHQLEDHGLGLVGGFTPLVLHRPGAWEAAFAEAVGRLSSSGGEVVVLAAATGLDGYDARPELSSAEWGHLLAALDQASAVASAGGMQVVLHPHVGTVVERPGEIERVLEGCSVPLCLDTGHVMAGGGDPVEVARWDPARIGHVHFKDVRHELAEQVAEGRLAYSEAVRAGLYCVLGEGDVDVPAIVGELEGARYEGWYVLEQDLMLDGEPPAGGGPQLQVRASRDHLDRVLADVQR